MKKINVRGLKGLFLIGLLLLLPSVGEAQLVNCDLGQSLQAAINGAGTPAAITVSGTCNETVLIREEKSRLTLNGQGTATINGPDPADSTVNIRGRGITILGFTITGGEVGILVSRGAAATIDGNVIQSTGTQGINVNQHSSARIVNNTIQNNPRNGIQVHESSNARIGFLTTDDTTASPNIVQGNGENGIRVSRSANARIVGNIISSNTGAGVLVNRASHADISSNTIDGNGQNGVSVSENSSVNLGNDTGDGIFDLPNDTTVGSENGGFGVRCSINSSANGRLGTLNGASGARHFPRGIGPEGGCINSLIP